MTMPDQQTMPDRCSSRGDEIIAIEMIGLPGAGKSTLIKPLLSALDAYGQTSTGFSGLSRRLAGDRSLANYLRCQEAAIAEARSRGNRFCVFQEGALHEVWRLYVDEKRIEESLLERAARLPDIIVCLNVSPEVAKRRIAGKPSRAHFNRILKEANLGTEKWILAIEALEMIRNACPPDRLIDFDNDETRRDEDLTGLARRIAEQIVTKLG